MSEPTKRNHTAYIFCGLFVLLMLVVFLKHAQWWVSTWSELEYQEYSVSEWLTNYEGGFVRRGLIGQLLFWAYGVSPFNVRLCMLMLPFVFSPLLLFVLLRMFWREQWPPTVVFCLCCLGANFFSPLIRRDFLVLLMAYLLFSLVARWMSTGRRSFFWGYLLVSCALILSYEPAVFIVFPIVFLVAGRRWQTWIVLPVILATFLSKGTAEIGQTIWQSWMPLFQAFPFGTGPETVGDAQLALGWETLPTFLFHLHGAYIGDTPSWVTTLLIIYMLAGTYYLITFLDVARLPFWPSRRFDARRMSNALLLQFAAMLPMFTVLSCDWGRNITLCTVSAFFVAHFFPRFASRIPFIDRLSGRMLSVLGRCRVLLSPVFYVFVALTIPMPLALIPGIGDSLAWLLYLSVFQ